MTRCTIILCGLMLVGCAAKQTKPTVCCEPAPIDELDSAVSASALLFSPPMYADDLPPDLSRDGRHASAFVGYEEQTTTFSHVFTDDQQLIRSSGNRDRYERRAFTSRFGSISR